ncbi:beta 1-4 rhamnosyltransferase Cps2T [Niallia sp. BSM11]|uniref:beta 1-4 rhamnosyltransferase Cps2T n=1 Tax=Niallia sp. BSM11 TaxID=3391576 RepID=UPI0039849231
MMNVFIIGSKGIPAKYGGFETFVDNLTRLRVNENIHYHVSCMDDNNNEFYHNNVRCFNVKVPNVGSARAVLYDIYSLRETIDYIKKNKLNDCIVYILACRIGPVFSYYKNILKQLNVKVFVNPDGHEWKRSKWNYAIRKYWKLSENLMVKHSDLLVCDSKGIEAYIHEDYKKYNPKTCFIAYGADVSSSNLNSDDEKILSEWNNKHDITLKNYYLIVGRFVPENNYELMISEFMKSNSTKDLVIISNVEENKFYDELLERTNFKSDPRIKFVGTVYNQEVLKAIRENAFAYIHGHEVGGTNPSLLEALASTDLNLLLGVVFNKEVGGDAAVYFSKDTGSLSGLINKVDEYESTKINKLSELAKNRIREEYSWGKIVKDYEDLFVS